jgi:hypothetical protein
MGQHTQHLTQGGRTNIFRIIVVGEQEPLVEKVTKPHLHLMPREGDNEDRWVVSVEDEPLILQGLLLIGKAELEDGDVRGSKGSATG